MLGNSIVDFFNNNYAACLSVYIVLMLGVVGVTTLLERISLNFKVKAKLSDGVVAGILLGMITSLPEMVTCITSVVENKSGDIGVGDIIGSNFFDLFVMAMCLIVCIIVFIKQSADQINTRTLVCTAAGTVWVLLGMLFSEGVDAPIYKTVGSSPLIWHGFNFFSILIFLTYALSIVFIVLDAKKRKNDDESKFDNQAAHKSVFFKLNVPTLIVLIIVVAAVLVTISVFLTYSSTSLIKYHWKSVFGESFGGAVLLGIVTSLPEIVCCVNLCIHKEYNMVINTMVGSCIFNLAVLSIANIALACVYTGQIEQQMFTWTTANLAQIITCFNIILFSILYLVFNGPKFKAKMSRKGNITLNAILLSLIIICFIVFIVLGFVYSGTK